MSRIRALVVATAFRDHDLTRERGRGAKRSAPRHTSPSRNRESTNLVNESVLELRLEGRQYTKEFAYEEGLRFQLEIEKL